MSYSNTQIPTTATQNTTQSRASVNQAQAQEEQMFQNAKLPNNPDVKIIECPLSQSSSKTEDNGNWINSFKEPIFVPAGSEVKVQSIFVESRGISGEVLTFDSFNDLTSRNDNVEHLYSFYVNNTGYNNMLLQYDLLARGQTPPTADCGHNYKKYKLQKWTNNWGRIPFFVCGNNVQKRIIQTNAGSAFEIEPNLKNEQVLGIESLYSIGYREDPFCAGRFLTSTKTDNNKIPINIHKTYMYGLHNGAEMLFYKFKMISGGFAANSLGWLIVDFGCTQSEYQTYISPQKVDQTPVFKGNTEKFFAFNNFHRGDYIKFNICEGQSSTNTANDKDFTNPSRIATSEHGGIYAMQGRVNLATHPSPNIQIAYTEILDYITNQMPTYLQQFLENPYAVYSNSFVPEPNFNQPPFQFDNRVDSYNQEPFFMREFYSQNPSSSNFVKLSEVLNNATGMTSPYYEISRTPLVNVVNQSGFVQQMNDKLDTNMHFGYSGVFGSTTEFGPENKYNIASSFINKLYQYRPNIQGNNAIVDMGGISIGTPTGGDNCNQVGIPITSLTLDTNSSGPSSHFLTITGTDTDDKKLQILNFITNCEVAYIKNASNQFEPILIMEDPNASQKEPTFTTNTVTFRVFRYIDASQQITSPTTLILTTNKFFSEVITTPLDIPMAICNTERSKYMKAGETGLSYNPAFLILNKTDTPLFNSPRGYWGENDANKNYYNTNFTGLLNHIDNDKIEEYDQGCQNIISDGTDFFKGVGLNTTKMGNGENKTFELTGLLRDVLQTNNNVPRGNSDDATVLVTARSITDNQMKTNDFSDDSHTKFDYFDFFNTFNYKIPKPYMSPSDLSSDYTDKTHEAQGIIDYDNGERYNDTKKSGILQNDFIIPVTSSNYDGNTYSTTTGEQNTDLTNGLLTEGYERNSFRAVGEMDSSLLTHSNTKSEYFMYFRNQHSFVRTYDPIDPNRSVLPVVSNPHINNTAAGVATNALLWSGKVVSQANSTFSENPYPTTTQNYPITYCSTVLDTKGNSINENQRISQFAGAVNGITLAFNNSLSVFEFSFLHTPYNTEFDKDSNEGGNTGIVIHYPTQQFVDNIEQVSGVKMLNWCRPNYKKNSFRIDEIDTFKPTPYPTGLDPFNNRDAIGLRFMNKIGFAESTLSTNESSIAFNNTDSGTTGSDIDAASSIIFQKVATEDEANIDSNVFTNTSDLPSKPEYVNRGLGDLIFYPYGVDTNTGNMKDATDIRFDFALPKFAAKGGLRVSNHNTGLGLPNTINSLIYTDPNTIPRTFNPDYKKYSSYIISSESSAIRADNLPIKFENGYFLLQSNIADNNPNFYLGKEGQSMNILSTILKTYISGDFIISFNSPYSFYTKSDQYIGYIENKIINSNGDVPANLGPNSAVIYQITNYNPRDATEQPTVQDTQDREYAVIDMIDKFTNAKGKAGTAKPNPLEVAVSDIGSLSDVILHPTPTSADIMGDLQQRILDYDVPNMTKSQREVFFSQDAVGIQMYRDIQAGVDTTRFLQEQEEFEASINDNEVLDRTITERHERDIFNRLSDIKHKASMRFLQKPEPELTDIGIEDESGSFRPRTRAEREELELQVGIGAPRPQIRGGEFTGKVLKETARTIAKPYKQEVTEEGKPLGPVIRKGIKEGEIKERLLREKGVGLTYRPVKQYQQSTIQRLTGRESGAEYRARNKPVDWSMVQDRSRFDRPIRASPAFELESESGIGTSIAPTERTEQAQEEEPKE